MFRNATLGKTLHIENWLRKLLTKRQRVKILEARTGRLFVFAAGSTEFWCVLLKAKIFYLLLEFGEVASAIK